MRLFLLVIFMSFSWVNLAKAINCPKGYEKYNYTDDDLKKILHELKHEYFSDSPGFLQTRIKFKDFKNKAYYLATRPNLAGNLLKKKNKPIKFIIKRSIYFKQCAPEPVAMKAILLHELKHLFDYYQMSRSEITGFGLKYLLSKKFRARYEKQTDCFSVHANPEFQKGLELYRRWVVKMINANFKRPKKRVKAKNTFYYSEKELRQKHFSCHL